MQIKILEILCTQIDCSDFYIKEESSVICKQRGILKRLETKITRQDIERLLEFMNFSAPLMGFERDFGFMIRGIYYRFHVFYSLSRLSLNIRAHRQILPTLDSRYHSIKADILKHTGLLLIAGATGSGKTTTANCLLHHINCNLNSHVICLEDPIEYRHEDIESTFTYRSIGEDTQSFESGLRAALREDPDVIFVGELRERAAIRASLLAAQSGHLLIATIHGSDCANALFRFMASFEDKDLCALELSQSLLGIITQKRNQDKKIICEILRATDGVKNLIKERKIHQILNQIALSKKDGMLAFSDSANQ